MKFLLDFFPILLFFLAYKWYGIYVATAVAIIASGVQVSWVWWQKRQVEHIHLITLGLLVVFGGLTLALRDPIFVMWKPTLVNWFFALIFIGSHWIGSKPLIERLMGASITIPKLIWWRLNIAWSGFFLFSGLVNLYVVYSWSGFFQARQLLLAASEQTSVDLSRCAELFQEPTLALCQAAQHSEEIWVNFKLFGMMGMTLIFVIAQALYLSRYITVEHSA
jgi:intracellular septation protein